MTKKAERKDKMPSLAGLIISDWLEHKTVIVLILAVLISAYSVVYFAWKNRSLNTEVQQLRDGQDQLDVEWRHMLLELNALSEHSRIERIATKQLDMKRPERKEENILRK